MTPSLQTKLPRILVMKFEVVNLKDIVFSVQDVEAHISIIIQNAKSTGVSAIKFIHGYGSHGKGGVISVELRKLLPILQRKKQITSYLFGNEWDISNQKCQKFLLSHPDCAIDEDLNKSNPGITIIGV